MAGTEGGEPKQEAAFGGRDVAAGGVGLVFELVGAGRHVDNGILECGQNIRINAGQASESSCLIGCFGR